MALRLDRLFHVLVVTGAASCAGDDTTSHRDPPIAEIPDAAPSGVDAVPATDGGASDLVPCFCDTAACCDRTAEPAIVAPGFTCCWSTTCP